jgi:hypothetical protein
MDFSLSSSWHLICLGLAQFFWRIAFSRFRPVSSSFAKRGADKGVIKILLAKKAAYSLILKSSNAT